MNCATEHALFIPNETGSKNELVGGKSKIHCEIQPASLFTSFSDLDCHKLCSICLCGEENGHAYIRIDLCSHEFHVGCLLDWLKVKDSCPCCRQKVVVYRCKIIRMAPSTPRQDNARDLRKGCRFFTLKSLFFGRKKKRKDEEVEDYKDLEKALITLRHARAWLYNEPFYE